MTADRHTRVAQRRIAETVAAMLRDRILTGVDERLSTQDQLVNEFGVSYPSIREAIRILETEGLVTVRRGNVGGGEVHRPNESSAAYHLGLALQGGQVTLADLAAGLQMLEPMCAAECAKRSDRRHEVIPVLNANIEAAAALVGEGVAFTRTAREFHDLLVALTPNATVRHVVSSLVALWSAQEETWAEVLTTRGDYPSNAQARSVVRAHRRILDEIAAGRSSEAERIARSHLAATQGLLLDRFDDAVVNASSARTRQALPSSQGWRV